MNIEQISSSEGRELRLSGRMDIGGSAALEKSLAAAGPARWLALDMRAVDYLTSAGIRVLLTWHRRQHDAGGALIVKFPAPIVVQALEVAGLADQLALAYSDEEAVAIQDRLATRHAVTSKVCEIRDRSYQVTREEDVPEARLRAWGASEAAVAAGGADSAAWPCASLQELGWAFGRGGLGVNRAQARAAMGCFVATGKLVALQAGPEPDYLLAAKPDEAVLFMEQACSLAGDPWMTVRRAQAGPVSLRVALGDLLALLGGPERGAVGILLAAECPAAASGVAEHLLVAGVLLPCGASGPSDDPGFAVAATDGDAAIRRLFCGHVLRFRGDAPRVAGVEEPAAMADWAAKAAAGLISVAVAQGDEALGAFGAVCLGAAHVAAASAERLHIAWPADMTPPDEWEVLVRRIYAGARRVALRRLTGGFSAITFQVDSHDAEGRRLLPTIMKISTLDFTGREERAYHEYVKPFILNNSTVIMGRATHGTWAGLRYNFLGVTGPDARLSWIADHYQQRPFEDVRPLFDLLFTRILHPWYGQSRRRAVLPFREHDPSDLFPSIAADAEKVLGISAAQERVACPELGRDLPNPVHFLVHQFPANRERSFAWNTAITHGDLNLNNILVDEKENLYVIDFSETRPRNIVSDFARMEPLLVVQMSRLDQPDDVRNLLEFSAGLEAVTALNETPPFRYRGDDPAVAKHYAALCWLRQYAAQLSGGVDGMLPWWFPRFQWTLPIVCFTQMPIAYKRLAFFSAALIVEQMIPALAAARPAAAP